ncbi:MAG: hypothetical protein JWR03_795 [Cohnella sp.]|nr:hypothetical protein [Cohnella sp.]
MAIIRMLTNEEMKEAVRLSDATFRDDTQPSMGEAFPYIFSDSMMHVSFGAFEEGKLLSFMGLVPMTIRIGDACLRVFSLGSVCTHPDARGKGIASEVLSEIYRYIRQAGASLLLVSGGRTLYTRTGCAPFGRTLRYGLDQLTADVLLSSEDPCTLKIREMAASDIHEIYETASRRDIRYDLGINELAMLIKVEALASCLKMKHRVLVAEHEGTVRSFGVFGIPVDPQRSGLVLEYAGDAASVVCLAAHAVKKFGLSGLDFPVPWHETELNNRLSMVPSSEEDNVGTIRIVDGQALVNQLRPWLDRKAAGNSAAIRLKELDDRSWLLEAGTNRMTLSADELVRIVFDRASTKDPELEGTGSMKGLFPVPFPYTAGLAYI